MNKQYFVYLMTNEHHSVIYTGITSDLKKRVYEHKEKMVAGFTAKYNIVKLVYYEVFADPENAILREKQIKGGSRRKKIDLINRANKEWRDLYDEISDCFASLAMTNLKAIKLFWGSLRARRARQSCL